MPFQNGKSWDLQIGSLEIQQNPTIQTESNTFVLQAPKIFMAFFAFEGQVIVVFFLITFGGFVDISTNIYCGIYHPWVNDDLHFFDPNFSLNMFFWTDVFPT